MVWLSIGRVQYRVRTKSVVRRASLLSRGGLAVLASFCRVAVTGNFLHANGNRHVICFSVFFHAVPSGNNITVITKLRRIVECLRGLRFASRSVTFLEDGGLFYSRFLRCPHGFRFYYSI